MQKSFLDKGLDRSGQEIFSQLRIPAEIPFFVRLDGRRFRAVSERVESEKPFDHRFAQCLIESAKAVFKSGFNPTLVYIASDELNVFFSYAAPFGRRVEKINSILAGVASSSFSLNLMKLFEKCLTVSFDSRIVIPSKEKTTEYLTWRQRDAWRNHNNAYGFWSLRKRGCKAREAARMLKGLKTMNLHEMLFRQGVNLDQTPVWQRRGILVYREPYQKQMRNHTVTRWNIKENWSLPLFSSTEGETLIRQILDWFKQKWEGSP